jgi:hypothetical protein
MKKTKVWTLLSRVLKLLFPPSSRAALVQVADTSRLQVVGGVNDFQKNGHGPLPIHIKVICSELALDALINLTEKTLALLSFLSCSVSTQSR